jgi:type VI secretion system protein ImpJ
MYYKTVWSEGMFLQPQHLQQHDRYLEFLLRSSLNFFQPYFWGFDTLELDQELLPLGKIGIKHSRGFFPDGTLIDIPLLGGPPCPLQISPTTVDTIIYLALPLRNLGVPEVTDNLETKQPIRYLATSQPIHDSTSDQINDTVTIAVGYPRLQLLSDVDTTAYSYLSIAKIKDVIAGQGIRLDEDFIPSLLNINNQPILVSYINELAILIHHRAEELAARMGGIEETGVSEIADFMLLQLMNRYNPLLSDLSQSMLTHPHKLYTVFIQLLGEIATYFRKSTSDIPLYQHNNLSETFSTLIASLRQSFLLMMNQNTQSLPIEQLKPGLWTAKLPDKNVLDSSDFILAVRAHITPEELRHELPKILKIAPFEEIMDLVTHALPGIELEALTTAPHKIPFYSGYTYFSLNQDHHLWQHLKTSVGLAFQLSIHIPDIHFELWVIQHVDNQYNDGR